MFLVELLQKGWYSPSQLGVPYLGQLPFLEPPSFFILSLHCKGALLNSTIVKWVILALATSSRRYASPLTNGSRSRASHKAWLFKVAWKAATRCVWMTTSTGSMASKPYTTMNKVSRVALLSVVWMDQSISSTHNPLVASNLFFKPFKICLLVYSACPLVCGLAMAVNRIWMLQSA